ncbi:MAG: flagellar filament capping protein FliD [Spirochaetaceae bacterium]|jgi:flagellar hook-associated protein 2|nr:flagellar filament capping protein FliD [Spirochaetaceae bacterium]
MPDISIPGVKSRFDTEKIVEDLMKIERLPRQRIERTNETLTAQKTNWQNLGRRITQVREDSRLLYSYQNPFNDKSAVSSNEGTLGAIVSREADARQYEFTVKQTAAADRFLSKPLDGSFQVPEGDYSFSVGSKSVSFKFSSGSLQEFVDTLNRRGQGTIKAGLVAVQRGNKSLVLESLVTGAENRLTFSGDALRLALQTGIVGQAAGEPKITNIKAIAARGASAINESVSGDGMQAPPMSNITISLGDVAPTRTLILRFETSITATDVLPAFSASVPAAGGDGLADGGSIPGSGVPAADAAFPPQPAIPAAPAGGEDTVVDGKYVIQRQRAGTGSADGSTDVQSDAAAPEGLSSDSPPVQAAEAPAQAGVAARVDNLSILSLEFSDGTSVALPPIKDSPAFSQNQYQLYPLADGRTITGININNDNTHRSVSIRNIQLFDPAPAGGDVRPLNPVSNARDAIVLMDGIEIQRPSNTIDDLVPGITLNARAAGETPVTLDVEADTEAVKDAVITLVGNYNRLMAELNVLTRNDESVIRELTYLTEEEQNELRGRLGVFSADNDLVRFRGRLQQIMTSPYTDAAGQEHLLSSFGIMTDARRGGGYDPTKMRGYLEINESALDEALRTNMDEMKQLFGRDSDGDLIIDTGLAYTLNQTLQPYVELGGIIATKTDGIDSRISANDRRIDTLDRQLTIKEQTLKAQYSELEGAYTRMERMTDSLDQFGRQTGSRR